MADCNDCPDINVEKCDDDLCEIELPAKCVNVSKLDCLDSDLFTDADGNTVTADLQTVLDKICDLLGGDLAVDISGGDVTVDDSNLDCISQDVDNVQDLVDNLCNLTIDADSVNIDSSNLDCFNQDFSDLQGLVDNLCNLCEPKSVLYNFDGLDKVAIGNNIIGSEEILDTYTLSGNTLSNNGDKLRIIAVYISDEPSEDWYSFICINGDTTNKLSSGSNVGQEENRHYVRHEIYISRKDQNTLNYEYRMSIAEADITQYGKNVYAETVDFGSKSSVVDFSNNLEINAGGYAPAAKDAVRLMQFTVDKLSISC